MSGRSFIVWCLAFGALGTYLFVTAPPPLQAEEPKRRVIPIEKALAMLNEQNEAARSLYAKEIVGAGTNRGFEFSEEWKRKDVHAGPLPALFLRETAAYLESSPTQVSLFLGSDHPINEANELTGPQTELFALMKETQAPESFYSRDTGRYVAMFPDVATSNACVECHNEHEDSPKKDWRIGEIMGATTWSHPASQVSVEEVLEMSDALLAGIERAYGMVLDELSRLPKKPRIGAQWPRDGYQLPSRAAFMKEVRRRAAPRLLERLSTEVRKVHASK